MAETSLTVPGIKYVIDTGLARINRYGPARQGRALLVEKISQAAARQRAAVAAGWRPGVCIRLCGRRPPASGRNAAGTGGGVHMAALRLGKVDEFPFGERIVAAGG